jgi:hypothetical protein
MLRKLNFLFILASLYINILGCASSSEFVSSGINLKKYERVAVLPFVDYPLRLGSGMLVADMVTTKLHSSGFNVIDRMQTSRALQEQGFGQSGAVDETSAPVVGRILGVQAFLTGSVNKYETIYQEDRRYSFLDGSIVNLTLKLIDSETSQIVWSGTAEGTHLGLNTEPEAASNAIGSIIKKLQKRILSPANTNLTISSEQESFSKTKTTFEVTPKRKSNDTLLPNFRAKVPEAERYSDEDILKAYRKKYPNLRNTSDVKLIKLIEAKYAK